MEIIITLKSTGCRSAFRVNTQMQLAQELIQSYTLDGYAFSVEFEQGSIMRWEVIDGMYPEIVDQLDGQSICSFGTTEVDFDSVFPDVQHFPYKNAIQNANRIAMLPEIVEVLERLATAADSGIDDDREFAIQQAWELLKEYNRK